MMGTLAAIGCILAAAALVTVVCLAGIRYDNWHEGVCYDERQEAAKGKGYKLAFWVGMVYYMTVLIFIEMEGFWNLGWEVDSYLLLFFGIAIQIMILHIHGLLTHSALPLSGKPKEVMICYILFGLSNLLGMGELDQRFTGYPFTGRGAVKWVRLIMVVLSFLLAGAHGLTLLWKEKEDG